MGADRTNTIAEALVKYLDDVALIRLIQNAQVCEKDRQRAWRSVLDHMKDEVSYALDPSKAKVVKGGGYAFYFYIRAKDTRIKVRVDLYPNGWAPYPTLFRVRLDTGKKRPAYRDCRDLEEIRKSFAAVTALFEQRDEGTP